MALEREGERRLREDFGLRPAEFLPENEAPPVNREEIRALVERRVDVASEAARETVKKCVRYRSWDEALRQELKAFEERVLPPLRQQTLEAPPDRGADPAEADPHRPLTDPQ